MVFALSSWPALYDAPFDAVIDVRSPAEFAEDHLPGAINLPVLSNEERARVGTIYVQQDRHLARKIGAALVARNAANHLETALVDKGPSWRPLIYCWRGGQRSGSFATILKQVGWQAQVLDGGYRSYRRLVAATLYDQPLAACLVVIDGGTGTAKTRLLDHLSEAGAQTVDLEALAAHRGSLFGPLPGGQPSQKAFESGLAAAFAGADPARPVFVEAESAKIGRINLPPSLWNAMRTAPVVRLAAPISARANHLVGVYGDLTSDPVALAEILQKLVPYHGYELVQEWQSMASEGRFAALAEALITTHYDPRYRRQTRPAEALDERRLSDLSDATLRAMAKDLIVTYG